MTDRIFWGLSALSHDAALTVTAGKKILFASHAERFSGVKNDPYLNKEIIDYALSFGEPEQLFFYEDPLLKKTRQFYSGQYGLIFKPGIISHLKKLDKHLAKKRITYIPHHLSHAAGGYFTSKFDSAVIVVIDAIGEWDTLSIWHAKGTKLKKIYSEWYPDSLGLFYSAMTQRVGLKSNDEEYILMGMSSFGVSHILYELIKNDFFEFKSDRLVQITSNLHKGCDWWEPDIIDKFNIAASTQAIFEEYLNKVMKKAKELTNETNLVYMGGCALNCAANSTIANIFDNIWIMPNPGDAGSSLGAIAAGTKKYLEWESPLLGYDIKGTYNPLDVVNLLKSGKVVGLAAGKAEFGPRALGNRSLLADPRLSTIKTEVNKIKQRQEFRPFAPAILEEFANDYFYMPVNKSPYMQYVAKCKEPDKFPAIVHIDGTSRVQTVNEQEFPEFYQLLKLWYKQTGCPMLLNTSLNIRSKPLVNTVSDAIDFSKKYNVTVVTAKNA